MTVLNEIRGAIDSAISNLNEIRRDLSDYKMDHRSLSRADDCSIVAEPETVLHSDETVGEFEVTLNGEQLYHIAVGWDDETESVHVKGSIHEVVESLIEVTLLEGEAAEGDDAVMFLAWAELLEEQAAKLRARIAR